VRECFPPPASLESQSPQRKNVFFSDERPEKKRSHSVMAVRIIAVYIRTCFWIKGMYHHKACCYLFSFLSKENKSKNKLCVLCASAVRIVFSKTLSGSPFKLPVLRVMVD